MDFFEKAHVSKKQPPKKDNKSEEIVKKQLKQMLHGYKRSDNELIRHSGNSSSDIVEAHRRLDDSASVSGFSDLELTNSESEGDIVPATTSITVENSSASTSDISVSNLSEINTNTDVNLNEINLDDYDSQDSISECRLNSESLSEYIKSDEDDDDDIVGISGDEIFSTDIEEISSESGSDDRESDIFDADGKLASKILEELGKNQNIKIKKRKVDEKPKKSKSKMKQTKDSPSNIDLSDNDVISMEALSIDNEANSADDNTTLNSAEASNSSPFISIVVSDMPKQRLSDILEDYKHPTIKKLHDIPQATSFTGLFSTEKDMVVEDIDSLVPELGDDNTIEDLGDDNTNDNNFEDLENDNTVQEVENDDVIEMLDNDASTDMPREETTTDYDNTILTDTEREPSTEEEVTKPVKVYHGKNCYVIILQHPSELYFNGKVTVKPIAGIVEVFGHTLKDVVNLYAPNNNFAQCFKTIESPNSDYGVFRKLTTEGLTVREAEEIVTTMGAFDGIISLSKLNDVRMDFVESNVFMDLFTKCNKAHSSLRKASADLGCSLVLKRPWRYFEENDSWDHAVSCGLEKNSRGIVCGGKGLGKSTFLRYYVNRLLANGPVLVIDLDPGQAEFTVAGNISATVVSSPLLGPNYTHLQTPEIMLNIDIINTMDNVNRYVSAVTEVLAYCRSNQAYSNLPWIINTMGMCTQMGLKFILLTILHAQPTFLLQIDTKVNKKRFEAFFKPNTVRNMYENFKYDRLFRNVELPYLDYTFILAQTPEGSDKHNTAVSPKDQRYLNFLAYFGELMNIYKGTQLLGIVPYEVSLHDVNVLTNVKVANDAVLKVINGKIVALCQLAIGDKGKVFTLQDNALLCHGHGLVRGVDYQKWVVYIVTPVAGHRLGAVDALVYADWAPELRGPERQLPDGTAVPYRSPTNYRQKQFMQSPRRRFNPLQLLKMSRSA
ncbi:hypothetical protein PYW07_005670 [Mythimna separata]|uniref:Polynucleotide 5'-hydroxyl-kinase NOL9 n=1 Tax=Mythimna separata TaxID=271217 RepID=A0AAD7YJY0_MYTSE|nr:hypothetical protein PYW07_005670 [Mythimna separata]